MQEWRYTEWADFPDCLLKSGVLMREDSSLTAPHSEALPDGALCTSNVRHAPARTPVISIT